MLPLCARGKPFGALILSRESGSFDPPDVTVADVLAGRAAVALENARLYQGIEAADRQKNEFLSMLAHELRNPLAPIVNAAEILRLALPNEPQVQWARNVIDRQLNHMVRLVDDLLDVSRITSGKIRLQRGPVQISEVLSTAIEASRPLIDRAGHKFEIAIPEQSIWVDGDAARLSQVATNLLRNAAKYTDSGGRVCLAVECEGDTAIISVRDTGIGIPPDMLHAVFELFTQVDRSLDRAQGGLGIGLTLVHRLVAMHGGTVSAVSEGLGKGSEFVVRLPTIPSPHAAEPAATPTVRREQSRLDQVSVLVVDDHVDGAGSLAALLGAFAARCMWRNGAAGHRPRPDPPAAVHHPGYRLAGNERLRIGPPLPLAARNPRRRAYRHDRLRRRRRRAEVARCGLRPPSGEARRTGGTPPDAGIVSEPTPKHRALVQ